LLGALGIFPRITSSGELLSPITGLSILLSSGQCTTYRGSPKQDQCECQFSDSLMPGHIEFGQKVINYRIPISMLVHFEEVINLIIKNAHFLVLFLFLRCIFVALESYSIFRSCLIYCKIDYVEGGSCDLPLPGFENRFRLILGTFKLDMPLSGLVIVHCNLLERESFCR
jgi:hypothetical protein